MGADQVVEGEKTPSGGGNEGYDDQRRCRDNSAANRIAGPRNLLGLPNPPHPVDDPGDAKR
jgi:hypothetical protein